MENKRRIAPASPRPAPSSSVRPAPLRAPLLPPPRRPQDAARVAAAIVVFSGS